MGLQPQQPASWGGRRRLLVVVLVVELGVVLVENGGDLRVEGGLVLDDGGEDPQEVRVHIGVGEVARRGEELLAIRLYVGRSSPCAPRHLPGGRSTPGMCLLAGAAAAVPARLIQLAWR